MGGNVGDAAAAADTFPKLLIRNAEIYGDRPATREKDLGIWQSWTWAQVLDETRAFAIGLDTLGLERGDAVAIIGDNRPRLYWTFVAVQSLGGMAVPAYQDSVAEEMAYILNHAEVKIAVVEDQEQVDKVMSVADQVPSLTHIVYDDTRGLRDYDHTHLHSFDALQKIGRAEMEQGPDAEARWLQKVNEGKGSDVSVMPYTSGTTGQPKGVMLTHSNVIETSANANAFDKLTQEDEMIAYLPMAWVGDHIFSFGQSFAAGFCVSCPESPDTVMQDRREIGPTFFFAPPRVFENMLTSIMVRMEDAGLIKRKMFDYFLDVAKRVGPAMLDGKTVSGSDRLKYGLGQLLVYGPLRNQMGMTRVRVAYTAGEAIGPDIFTFYRALGINLKQLYGSTEASVHITMQPDGEIYPDTVGKPAPDVEIRIADSGEVQFKSPGVFLKYFKNDEATESTKSDDGWVHTGDAGFFDNNGHLKIIDRAKDVGQLKDGTLFAPKYIENKLKFYPNIKEAVAFGHDRDFCSAMINIDLVAVGNWAERNDVVYASYQELAAHPQVYEMIERDVAEVNRALANEPNVAGSQIRRFLILHKELDADDGELTRTMKVRRSLVEDRYGPLVTALYDGSDNCNISTEVTFEDGRRGTIEGDVKIVEMSVNSEQAQKEAAE